MRDRLPRATAFIGALVLVMVLLPGGSASARQLERGAVAAEGAPSFGPAVNKNCTAEPGPFNPGNGEDIVTPAGYRVSVFAKGLNFPTAIAFTGTKDNFSVLVLESGTGLPSSCNNRKGPGYIESSQDNPFTPDILKFDQNGNFVAGPYAKPNNTTDCSGDPNASGRSHKFQCDGPAIGLVFRNGFDGGTLFASDSNQGIRGAAGSGNNSSRIVTVDLGGDATNPFIIRLPTGDHPTEQLLVKDDFIYWSQGSATNAGVTGHDNGAGGNQHDIPCQTITLSENTFDSGDGHRTSGYSNHGVARPGATVPAFEGASVESPTACTGAILRARIIDSEGNGDQEGNRDQIGHGPIQPYSWGYRNPFGIRFAPDDHPLMGHLFITENGEDERGARPTNNAPDRLQVAVPQVDGDKVTPDWHGWPDRFGDLDSTQSIFNPIGGPADDACPTTAPNTPAETACLRAHGDIPVKHVLAFPPEKQQPRSPIAIEPVDIAVVGPDFAPDSFTGPFVRKGAALVSREGDLGFSPGNGEPEEGHDIQLVNFVGEQPLQLALQRFAFNCPKANQAHYPDGGPACLSVPGRITSQPMAGDQAFCAKPAPLRGINRPVTLMFGPDGALYLVDYGIVRDFGQSDPHCKFVDQTHAPLVQIPHTGVIWKISKTG